MDIEPTELKDSETIRVLWSSAVARVSHIETLIFTAVGLMMAAVYFSISGDPNFTTAARYAVCGVLVALEFVILHLLVTLMAFGRAVVSIERDHPSFDLWCRVLALLQWPFFVTYFVLVASPVLLAAGTIGYLLRAQTLIAIVASVSLVVVSVTLVVASTLSHHKDYRKAGRAVRISNEDQI